MLEVQFSKPDKKTDVQNWPAGHVEHGEQTPALQVSQTGQSLSFWHAGPQCPAALPGSLMQTWGAGQPGEHELRGGGIGPASEASGDEETPEEASEEPDVLDPLLDASLASSEPPEATPKLDASLASPTPLEPPLLAASLASTAIPEPPAELPLPPESGWPLLASGAPAPLTVPPQPQRASPSDKSLVRAHGRGRRLGECRLAAIRMRYRP